MDLRDLPVPHDDGHFISERVSRVVDIIRETWPTVDVKWIPPEVREEGDAAFVLVEKLPDGREVPFLHVQTEAEFDHRILAKIEQADGTKRNILEVIEAEERALRRYQIQQQQEQIDEHADFIEFVISGGRDRKNYVKHNGFKFD